MGKYSNRVKKKVLVAGDVMLDIYSSGKVGRISPEAPVPILLREKETVRNVLGGAANVAANIAAAGVRTGVLSVTGCDSYGETLLRGMEKAGIDTDFVLRDEERVTTSKLRYIGQNHQQILRVDTNIDSHRRRKPMSKWDKSIIFSSIFEGIQKRTANTPPPSTHNIAAPT